jgi:hypothetical protein
MESCRAGNFYHISIKLSSLACAKGRLTLKLTVDYYKLSHVVIPIAVAASDTNE